MANRVFSSEYKTECSLYDIDYLPLLKPLSKCMQFELD